MAEMRDLCHFLLGINVNQIHIHRKGAKEHSEIPRVIRALLWQGTHRVYFLPLGIPRRGE
jgi:hypothetical protein